MMTPSRRALACALSASLALSSTGSFAQKRPADASSAKKEAARPAPSKADRERARAAFKRGDERFAAGDFAAAADAFKEANSILPAAQATYRQALSLDKAGKTSEALTVYKQFLDAPPPEKMTEQKAAAEARVKELSVGSVKLTSTPPGAVITVDGKPAAGPTPLTLSLAPGAHTIMLSSTSFEPVTREVTVTAGGSSDVAVDLKPVAPAPAASATAAPLSSALAPPPVATGAATEPPVKDEPPPSRIPAYVTLGLAGAGVVVGTIFGIKALSSRGDFKDQPTTAHADDTERNALIADMAFGVALTLGITGALLLRQPDAAPKTDTAPKTSFRLLPLLTPQTQGAAAVLRF